MCYLTFLGVFEASLWYQPHPSCLCAGQRGERLLLLAVQEARLASFTVSVMLSITAQ